MGKHRFTRKYSRGACRGKSDDVDRRESAAPKRFGAEKGGRESKSSVEKQKTREALRYRGSMGAAVFGARAGMKKFPLSLSFSRPTAFLRKVRSTTTAWKTHARRCRRGAPQFTGEHRLH